MWIVGLSLATATACGPRDDVVGGACRDDRDCAERCLEGRDFPDGTCTVDCRDDRDCPGGTYCVDKAGGVCLVAAHIGNLCGCRCCRGAAT